MESGPREVERIKDPADPRLAPYRELRDPSVLRRHGVFIAESREVVRILLTQSRFVVRSLLLTPAALAGLEPFLTALPEIPPILLVDHALVEGMTGIQFHRGALAAGEIGEPLPLASFVPPAAAPTLLVGLDAVTDPDNVGSIFRNCLAFGVNGVLLSPRCADPLYRKSIRVSMGSALRLPFTTLSQWPADLHRLRDHDFTIVALTPDAEGTRLGALGRTVPIPKRMVLLVGNEGEGLPAAVREDADLRVRIPMAGRIDSINAGAATAVALHHLYDAR